jgi:TIR domain
MADVFISHRGSDRDDALRLALALRADGHQVWLDEWKVELGDSIIGKMNEGLESATHVVVAFSGAGLAPWMDREWMSALAGQLDGHGVRVLPVLLTGGELPALLRDIKYADLAADWAGGVADLQRVLVR